MAKININELTKEQIAKAMACETAEELMAVAKSEGIELTKEEADAYLAEMSDFELEGEEWLGDGEYTDTYVVIDGSELRLRLEPSTNADTFKWPDGTNRHPKVGERFYYLGEEGDFYQISFHGNALWVSKKYTHLE